MNVHEELFNLCMEAKACEHAADSVDYQRASYLFGQSLERLSRELVAWEDLAKPSAAVIEAGADCLLGDEQPRDWTTRDVWTAMLSAWRREIGL